MKFFRKTNKLTENKRPNNTTKKIINLPNRVFNFITNSYSSIYIKNIIYQPKLGVNLFFAIFNISNNQSENNF